MGTVPIYHRAASARSRISARACFSVSAGSVPGDQVNLYRMQRLAGVTASSFDGENRPEGVLETRGDTAWMPDLASEGPVHLTATFATPLDPANQLLLDVVLLQVHEGGHFVTVFWQQIKVEHFFVTVEGAADFPCHTFCDRTFTYAQTIQNFQTAF